MDVDDPDFIQAAAEKLRATHPTLNAVIHTASMMKAERVTSGELAHAEATVTTNLLRPIRLTAALLPQLLTQPQAAVLTVSSGLAFMTLASTPTYCATKAAIHAYTQALRYQLKNTAVQVLEIVPPYVQTELMGAWQAKDPHAMPLNEFITEVMSLLKSAPQSNEVCVERVKPMRFAEVSGQYDSFFSRFNEEMAAARNH